MDNAVFRAPAAPTVGGAQDHVIHAVTFLFMVVKPPGICVCSHMQ